MGAEDRQARRGRRLVFRDYHTDPVTLATGLLGAVMVRALEDGTRLSGRIVETEAYLGVEDKAAHSVGARRTARTEPMFARAGTAYVFMTYGMHFCFNAVCGEVDEPVAVLVRALEPLEGVDAMRANRGAGRRAGSRPVASADLCSGPANLCRALGIDRGLNGIDLVTDRRLWIEQPGGRAGGLAASVCAPGVKMVNTPRIGVEYAQEWALRPLRWFVAGSPSVSAKRVFPDAAP